MTNRIKGEIALQHDGKAYTMVLDFNALADFEDATGANAVKVLSSGDLSIRQMRALFQVGLRRHHPEITLTEAGHILQSNMAKLGDAIAAAFPDAEGNATGAA
jgi:hypothetical protein